MTAPTQQNTEFSVTPVVVVTPVRCAEGKRLIKAWVNAYDLNVRTKPHPDESWQTVMGRGYMKYAKHASKCSECMDFELARRARYK